MLESVAKDIASIASNVTGYYIVITDEKGIIIGTSDEEEPRMGTLHEGSLEVIRKREMMSHDENACKKLEGTYPGITAPIFLKDEVVGTVGIGGISTQVQRYGLLVKTISEVMLRDRIEAESILLRHQNTQMLVSMILAFNGSEQSKTSVEDYGRLLNFDMNVERRAVMISVGEMSTKKESGQIDLDVYRAPAYQILHKAFPGDQDIITAYNNDRYLIFDASDGSKTAEQIRNRAAEIRAEISELGARKIRIGIGGPCNDVGSMRESYVQAKDALAVASYEGTQPVVMIDDIPLERIIIELAEKGNHRIWERNLRQLLKGGSYDEAAELIICWCESRFNFMETSRRLGIHKSTLTYRVKRMKEIYGIDLYDFKRTLTLYISIKALAIGEQS